ncbi:type II secretion system F family protein [Candidatus Uhrbacteria bacterium]|nr:type II secretion system F family protein [Candidatus Uhrbacteria bacterium]
MAEEKIKCFFCSKNLSEAHIFIMTAGGNILCQQCQRDRRVSDHECVIVFFESHLTMNMFVRESKLVPLTNINPVIQSHLEVCPSCRERQRVVNLEPPEMNFDRTALIDFFTFLTYGLRAGLDALSCLERYFGASPVIHPGLGIVAKMAQKISRGSALSQAMNNYAAVFGDIPIVLVSAGEADSHLQHAMADVAYGLELEGEIRGRHPSPLTPYAATAYFAFFLGALLTNGVPIIDSLELIQRRLASFSERTLAEALGELRDRFIEKGQKGHTFTDCRALLIRGGLDPLGVELIIAGEENGELDLALSRLTILYERKLGLPHHCFACEFLSFLGPKTPDPSSPQSVTNLVER